MNTIGLFETGLGVAARIATNAPAAKGAGAGQGAITAFRDELARVSQKSDALTFSAHAQSRLKSRNIEMTPQIMDKLESAVKGAAQKGSNNSLILLSDLAFIVNVPNRTVVTAMDGESVKENIFTNIDSTVIAGR